MVDEAEKVTIAREGGCVVKIRYPDDMEVTLPVARRLTSKVYREFGEEQIALVHVAGSNTSVAEGVREFLAGKSGSHNKIAEAFVVKNLNQRILGNFYLRVGKPVCPTEVFTLEDEAVKWVRMYCPKENSVNKNTGDEHISSPVRNFGAN